MTIEECKKLRSDLKNQLKVYARKKYDGRVVVDGYIELNKIFVELGGKPTADVDCLTKEYWDKESNRCNASKNKNPIVAVKDGQRYWAEAAPAHKISKPQITNKTEPPTISTLKPQLNKYRIRINAPTPQSKEWGRKFLGTFGNFVDDHIDIDTNAEGIMWIERCTDVATNMVFGKPITLSIKEL